MNELTTKLSISKKEVYDAVRTEITTGTWTHYTLDPSRTVRKLGSDQLVPEIECNLDEIWGMVDEYVNHRRREKSCLPYCGYVLTDKNKELKKLLKLFGLSLHVKNHVRERDKTYAKQYINYSPAANY